MPAKPSSFCEVAALSARRIHPRIIPPYRIHLLGPAQPCEANAVSSPLNDNRAASESAVQVNLKDLLESADSRSNPLVHLATIV